MGKRRWTRRDFIEKSAGATAAAIVGTPALHTALAAGLRNPQAGGTASEVPYPVAGCPPTETPESTKHYRPRFEGPRWQLIYGAYRGVERYALDELQKAVQRHIPYVVEVRRGDAPPNRDAHLILAGTIESNPLIAELKREGKIDVPSKAEGYTVACFPSPWNPDRKCIVIAGTDSSGVLYGTVRFNQRLGALAPEGARDEHHILDSLSDFNLEESPAIANRGIWSWGYVIYDYRRFIDHLACLRMNRLLFWNDVPPLNCESIIEYAHDRGVRVVLGFPWGWGMEGLDPNSRDDRKAIKESVLCAVDQHYAHLGMDAIYFQTFTETSKKEIAGKPIALLARDWVNEIAGAVLDRHPDLRIEWGLHASSILENYTYLRDLDARVSIVWEDAGVIPYSYDPLSHPAAGKPPSPLDTPEATVTYSEKLATLRADREFAMVAKGWTTLSWKTEFEHHGPFIMGERDPGFIRNRLHERQPRWDYVNNLWLKNYPIALRFFQKILASDPSQMSVLGLIEDGLFEEKIQISTALFAETIWNPRRSAEEVLQSALNPYYKRLA